MPENVNLLDARGPFSLFTLMNDPIKSDNTGIIVAVIVAALLVVGGIFWNQHDSEDRAHQAESDAVSAARQRRYSEMVGRVEAAEAEQRYAQAHRH